MKHPELRQRIHQRMNDRQIRTVVELHRRVKARTPVHLNAVRRWARGDARPRGWRLTALMDALELRGVERKAFVAVCWGAE